LFLELGFLALMEAASSCGGVRHKRYSVQQEIAPKKSYRLQQFLSVPQHAWIDEDNAENSRHDYKFQGIMK
jgi:hypothetical protein